MKRLQISIAGCIARLATSGVAIVCGNRGYEIEFAFDEEWDAFPTKKARFITNGAFEDVEFTGNVCLVPELHKTNFVEVGVYVDGADLATTTGATIRCLPSIKCSTDKPKPEYIMPPAEQILAAAANVTALNGQVAKNSWDITSIQQQLDIDVTEFGVIEGANERVTVPYGALPYAKIAEIHGASTQVLVGDSGYTECVENIPARIVTNTGVVLFEMSSNAMSRLKEFGVVGNYIYFEDGKAYYKQTTKAVERYADGYDLEDGEEWGAELDNEGAQIVILAEPIVTDISDYITFDGLINVEGCEYIVIEPKYTEEYMIEFSASAGCSAPGISGEFVMPATKFIFER